MPEWIRHGYRHRYRDGSSGSDSLASITYGSQSHSPRRARPARPHTPLMPHPDLAASLDGFPDAPKHHLVVGSTILRLQEVVDYSACNGTRWLDCRENVEQLLYCANGNASQWIEQINMCSVFNCAEVCLKQRVQAFELYKQLCTMGQMLSNEVQCHWAMPRFSNRLRAYNAQLTKRWDNVFGTFLFKCNQNLRDPTQCEEFLVEMDLFNKAIFEIKGVELDHKSIVDSQHHDFQVRINCKQLMENNAFSRLSSILLSSVSGETITESSISSNISPLSPIYSEDSVSIIPVNDSSLKRSEMRLTQATSSPIKQSTSTDINSDIDVKPFSPCESISSRVPNDFPQINDALDHHHHHTHNGDSLSSIHTSQSMSSNDSGASIHNSSIQLHSWPINYFSSNYLNQLYPYIERPLYRPNPEDYPPIYNMSRYI